ncbi:hypothetical protein CU098_013719, partial [Rhizopus stolonifer]
MLFSQDLQSIHWKHPDHISQELEKFYLQIIRGIESNKYQFFPFFVKHCQPLTVEVLPTVPSSPSLSFVPFVNSFQFATLTGPITRVSTKEFRLTFQSATSAPERLQAIASAFWVGFWSWSLLPVARNMMYRFLVSKLPTRQFLHPIIPDTFPSPL